MERQEARGTVALLGGAGAGGLNHDVLRGFVLAAGGPAARLLLVPTASEESAHTIEKYVNAFELQDVQSIEVADIRTRRQAGRQETCARLGDATGVVFSGGDQRRLLDIVGGTRFLACLRDRWLAGLAIAGSSAGAMALGHPVIVRGEPSAFYRGDGVRARPGLALLPDLTVDTHVAARGRLGRLLAVVVAHPGALGLGIEEDTAVFIAPDDTLEVVGEGIAIALDALQLGHRRVPDGRWDDRLSAEGLRLHVLAPGDRLDLQTRRFLPGLVGG